MLAGSGTGAGGSSIFFGSDGRHVRAKNAGILCGHCSFSSVWHSELKNSSRNWLRIPTKWGLKLPL